MSQFSYFLNRTKNYVEDHCKAIDLIIHKGRVGEVYNIGGRNELGWLPETKFVDGIKKTIKWYLENQKWWQDIINGEYQNYYEKMGTRATYT